LRAAGVRIFGPNASVAQVFAAVQQQLPSVPSIDSFLGSHQTGIAQLAIAYCSVMVDTDALRTQFFGAGVASPNQGSGVFANAAAQDPVVNAITTKVINSNLTSQPSAAVVSTAIRKLLTTIGNNTTSQGNPKGAGNAMKAACGAALGSAATTVQ